MSTPESQKVCQLCGYANTTKARFCRNCGNNLEKIPVQQSFTIPSSTEGPIMFSGLSKIKKGFFVLVLATLLLVIVSIVLAFSLVISSYVPGQGVDIRLIVYDGLIAGYIAGLVYSAVILYALIFLLRKGFISISRIIKDYSIGVTGITILIIISLANIALSIGVLSIINPNFSLDLLITLTNLRYLTILYLIGGVPLTIGLFRMGKNFNSNSVIVGSILSLFSWIPISILPLVGFIGWIVTAFGISGITNQM